MTAALELVAVADAGDGSEVSKSERLLVRRVRLVDNAYALDERIAWTKQECKQREIATLQREKRERRMYALQAQHERRVHSARAAHGSDELAEQIDNVRTKQIERETSWARCIARSATSSASARSAQQRAMKHQVASAIRATCVTTT